MLDPETGRTQVRLVDIHSTRYTIARRYMLRLRRDDFEDPHELAKFAATCNLIARRSSARSSSYLIESEPPGLILDLQKHAFTVDEESSARGTLEAPAEQKTSP